MEPIRRNDATYQDFAKGPGHVLMYFIIGAGYFDVIQEIFGRYARSFW